MRYEMCIDDFVLPVWCHDIGFVIAANGARENTHYNDKTLDTAISASTVYVIFKAFKCIYFDIGCIQPQNLQ